MQSDVLTNCQFANAGVAQYVIQSSIRLHSKFSRITGFMAISQGTELMKLEDTMGGGT